MKFNKEVSYDNLIDVIKQKYNIKDFNYSNKGEIVEFNEIDKARIFLRHSVRPTILVDSDADGISSASQLVYYYNQMNVDYKIMCHETKSHGISNKEAKEYIDSNSDLLIVSDAGSNNIEQIKTIIENKKRVLVLDHHIIEEKNIPVIEELNKSEYFCLVSPLIHKQLNHNLTGAMVVLETLKPLSDDNLFPMAVIGEVGDCGDTSDKYIHGMVNYGLNMLENNNLLSQFLENDASQRDLSFKIIPLINATCRIGSKNENEEMVELLANTFSKNEKFTVEKRKKNKTTGKFEMVEFEVNKYQNAKDELSKLKQKQNRITDKLVKDISSKIIYNKDILIVKFTSEDVEGNFSLSGLMATKLMQKYNKPTLVMFDEEKYFGSMRSNSNNSFKDYLQGLNIFNFVQGHDNAAGFELEKHKLSELFNLLDLNKFKDVVDEIQVDIVRDRLDASDVIATDNNKRLFGGNVTYPVIGYKNIEFDKRNCIQKNNTIRLIGNNIEVVLFKQPEGKLDDMISQGFNSKVSFNFYGSPNINDFYGKKYQIIAEDIEKVENTMEDLWF